MGRFIKWLAEYAGHITVIVGCAILIFWKPIKSVHDRRKSEKEEERKFRKAVMDKLNAFGDDIADLQYERLSQAHDFYIDRGWCPTSKKQQLCNMYQSYTAKGRNHLSAHYEREILELSDHPEK